MYRACAREYTKYAMDVQVYHRVTGENILTINNNSIVYTFTMYIIIGHVFFFHVYFVQLILWGTLYVCLLQTNGDLLLSFFLFFFLNGKSGMFELILYSTTGSNRAQDVQRQRFKTKGPAAAFDVTSDGPARHRNLLLPEHCAKETDRLRIFTQKMPGLSFRFPIVFRTCRRRDFSRVWHVPCFRLPDWNIFYVVYKCERK